MKKRALTIQELIVSMSLVAIFAIVLVNVLTSLHMDKKKISLASQQFHSDIDALYTKLATQKDSPFNIKKNTSQNLMDGIANYLDMTSSATDCSDLKVNSHTVDVCAKTINGIEMGIAIDNSCKMELSDIYEYLRADDIEKNTSDIQTNTITNACGYIIYATKKSKYIYKEDMFIIPLKNINVQKHTIITTST